MLHSLLFALALGSTALQVGPAVELSPGQQRVQLRVWELIDLAADGVARREVVEQLARLGAGDLRPLFEVYAGSAVRGDEHPGVDRAARAELLREALGRISPDRLFKYLRAEVVENAAIETRLRSLELLAECSHPLTFELVCELLSGVDPVQLTSPHVQARVETSLRATLARHQRAMREFAKDPVLLAAPLWPLIARAAPESAAELLLSLLGSEPELDRVVLERLGLHARSNTAGWGGSRGHVEVVESVRDRLAHPEWEVREQALLTMGYLADPDSIPMQISLLRDRERAVQRAAAFSLERATGMRFGSDSAHWSAWFEEQAAWFRQAGLQAQRRLLACPDAEAIAIVRDFTQRRIFRHELSDMLAPVLSRENHYVVGAVCATLKQLGSPRAVGHLIESLERADPESRAIIHRTLVELTGRDLPASRRVWAAELTTVTE